MKVVQALLAGAGIALATAGCSKVERPTTSNLSEVINLGTYDYTDNNIISPEETKFKTMHTSKTLSPLEQIGFRENYTEAMAVAIVKFGKSCRQKVERE